MPSLPYRLVALDLDDTLLGPTQRLSERTLRAVRALVTRGAYVVLASGRLHSAIQRFADQLGLETLIISYNGAMVRHSRTQEIWLHEQLPADLAEILLDYCAPQRLQLNWYLHDTVLTAAYTPWLSLYQRRTLAPVEIRPNFVTEVRGTHPTKLIIVDDPQANDVRRHRFQEQFGTRLYITRTADEYLEFMPPTANKGIALALVASRLGIAPEETIAFGDGSNDLPMIRWAGMGVAVANARAELQAVADRIAPSNEEDGVAVVLEEIFGI